MFGRKKRKAEPGVSVDLPITPMLDMSFQLLAFFILTFKAPSMEGQIALKLPSSDPPPSATPVEDKEILPEDKDDEYTLVISPNRDGAAGDMSLKTPTTAYLFPVDDAERLKALFQRLKELQENQKATKKNASIKIEIYNDLLYAQLVTLMDVCRKAGFNSIGIVRPQANKEKGT
jgi:biopolymer transport protein ExbD